MIYHNILYYTILSYNVIPSYNIAIRSDAELRRLDTALGDDCLADDLDLLLPDAVMTQDAHLSLSLSIYLSLSIHIYIYIYI